jgi:PPOX class probable F420-dependent enzyme
MNSTTMIQAAPTTFAPLQSGSPALLTTFRRNGQPVSTPVGVLLHDGNAYFVTWSTTGKVKRLAHTPQVTLAPCTRQGRPTGPAIAGTAHRLDGAARDAARRRGGWRGRVWELAYRLFLRADAIYYEVVPQSE